MKKIKTKITKKSIANLPHCYFIIFHIKKKTHDLSLNVISSVITSLESEETNSDPLLSCLQNDNLFVNWEANSPNNYEAVILSTKILLF